MASRDSRPRSEEAPLPDAGDIAWNDDDLPDVDQIDWGAQPETPTPPAHLSLIAPAGPKETALNSLVNAIPLGGRVADAGTAILLRLARAAGVGAPGARLTPQSRDELAAQGTPMPPEVESTLPGLVDAYRQSRDIRSARTGLGAVENPNAALAGTAAGIGLSMLAPLPKATTGVKGMKGSVLDGALTGAGYGALTGLTEGDADLTRGEFGRAAENTALGAGIGATIGSALPLAIRGGWKTRAGAGAVLGGGYGSLTGGTEDGATPASVLINALKGAGTGASAAVSIPLAGRILRAAYQGVVKPTDSAKLLRAKGVPLTVGQMNPESKLAQMEEVGAAHAAIGPEIQAQRQAAVAGWQNAVLDEARPPGMPRLDPKLPIDERLAQAYRGFDEAYAPAKGLLVEPRTSAGVPLVAQPPSPPTPPPAQALPLASTTAPVQPTLPLSLPAPGPDGKIPLLRDARGRFLPRDQQPRHGGAPPGTGAAPKVPAPATVFETVVDDPTILATAEERGVVKRFLANELTLIQKEAEKGKVTSDALLKMRHNIRMKHTQELKAENFPKAQMLENAERQVTDVLESSLPGDAQTALRAADRQYGRYKTVESAVAKSGDQPNGFTPPQLSSAVRGDLDKGTYARGGGGEMREMARAGREVLEARIPKTGIQMLAKTPGLSYPLAAMSYTANLPRVQRFLLGEGPIQRGSQAVDSAMSRLIRNPYEAQVGAVLPRHQRPAFTETEEQQRQRALAEILAGRP